jgi:hypothetical protein
MNTWIHRLSHHRSSIIRFRIPIHAADENRSDDWACDEQRIRHQRARRRWRGRVPPQFLARNARESWAGHYPHPGCRGQAGADCWRAAGPRGSEDPHWSAATSAPPAHARRRAPHRRGGRAWRAWPHIDDLRRTTEHRQSRRHSAARRRADSAAGGGGAWRRHSHAGSRWRRAWRAQGDQCARCASSS